MFVVVNKYVLAKRFEGVAFWPFIFIKREELCRNPVFMNHERIHLRQQLELLVLPFFVIYGLEYLFGLLKYRSTYHAYKNISFEREAYEKERDLGYLKERRFWEFLKYWDVPHPS